ncbi:MAG: tetratricopeptide repeat protein [Planctomycetota bacterium]
MRPFILAILAFSFAVHAASAQDLSIWKDPEYQRRFNEGLIAESDVEPSLSEDDVEAMQEILGLMGEERIDDAITRLGELIGPEQNAVFDYTLGHLLFQKDRLDQAVIAFRSAVDKYPKYRRAWNYLGEALVKKQDWSGAIPALTRVLEFGGGRGTTYGLLGFAHEQVGNYISAESAYRMAVLLDPGYGDWQIGLARTFNRQERWPELASFCESLLRVNPESETLYLLQAKAFIGLDRPRDAAENFEMLEALGKSTVVTLNSLGLIYVNDGLFDLGVRAYLRAIEMDPAAGIDKPMEAARNMVLNNGLMETEMLLDGINGIYGAELPDEMKREMLKLRSRIAVARGGGEEEAKVLEEVVALDPLDGEAIILLGHYYRRNGDDVKANNWFERAERIDGFLAEALKGRAQVLVGQGRYAEAEPLLRQVMDIAPSEGVRTYLEQVQAGARARS